MQTRDRSFSKQTRVKMFTVLQTYISLLSLPLLLSPHPLTPFSPPGSTEEGTVGEISIQVDLYTHPGTGEQRINVKGAARDNPFLPYFQESGLLL